MAYKVNGFSVKRLIVARYILNTSLPNTPKTLFELVNVYESKLLCVPRHLGAGVFSREPMLYLDSPAMLQFIGFTTSYIRPFKYRKASFPNGDNYA